jgi:putative transposase
MTKEEFEVLQLDLQQSGKPLMSYLKDAGVKYSTYTYWRRKMEYEHKPEHPIAPISLTQSPGSVFTGTVSSGATLLFPNGLRAHFGSGTEDVLRELLDKSLVSHVLPE